MLREKQRVMELIARASSPLRHLCGRLPKRTQRMRLGREGFPGRGNSMCEVEIERIWHCPGIKSSSAWLKHFRHLDFLQRGFEGYNRVCGEWIVEEQE